MRDLPRFYRLDDVLSLALPVQFKLNVVLGLLSRQDDYPR